MNARQQSTEPGVPAICLTVEQAAAALNLGTTAVRAMIRSGELPAAYFGKSPRIPAADLERMVQERVASRLEVIQGEREAHARMRAEMPPTALATRRNDNRGRAERKRQQQARRTAQ